VADVAQSERPSTTVIDVNTYKAEKLLKDRELRDTLNVSWKGFTISVWWN
jgi:hypothetical protein